MELKCFRILELVSKIVNFIQNRWWSTGIFFSKFDKCIAFYYSEFGKCITFYLLSKVFRNIKVALKTFLSCIDTFEYKNDQSLIINIRLILIQSFVNKHKNIFNLVKKIIHKTKRTVEYLSTFNKTVLLHRTLYDHLKVISICS